MRRDLRRPLLSAVHRRRGCGAVAGRSGLHRQPDLHVVAGEQDRGVLGSAAAHGGGGHSAFLLGHDLRIVVLVELAQGVHTVTVENREDGARLSRILFSTKDYATSVPTTPEG